MDQRAATLSPSAATSSHLKDRTSLTDPTTAAGSLRPPASTAHPRPLVDDVLHVRTSPNPDRRRLSSPRSLWPVRHGDSGGGRAPCFRHRSRLHCGTIPLCRHGERFPFHRSHETATRNPPHSRLDSPLAYWLTARIHPFDPPNRANFDSVSIRTVNYQNCGILRFDAESPFESIARTPNSAQGAAPNLPVPTPQTGRRDWLLDKDRNRSPSNHGFDTRLDTGRAVTTVIRA